jgi:hypothetical protein
MYQIASDVLMPIRVKGERLYHGRVDELIDSELLSQLGFPPCSYSSMVRHLRRQLAEARLDIINFGDIYKERT